VVSFAFPMLFLVKVVAIVLFCEVSQLVLEVIWSWTHKFDNGCLQKSLTSSSKTFVHSNFKSLGEIFNKLSINSILSCVLIICPKCLFLLMLAFLPYTFVVHAIEIHDFIPPNQFFKF
jgi:hypothetical protein